MWGNGVGIGTQRAITTIVLRKTRKGPVRETIEFCAAAPGAVILTIAGLLTASTSIPLIATPTMGSDWSGTNPLALFTLLPLSCRFGKGARSAKIFEILKNEDLQSPEESNCSI